MASSFKQGEMVLGRYVFIEHIGRGGMADVYKALDTFEGGFVAIKVLSKYFAQDPRIYKRFEREIRVLTNMHHPHIVELKEVGEHEGSTVLVLPYLDFGSLSDRLKEGRVSITEGAKIIDQVAGALQYSHEQGVIHRDVKPSNILLNKAGDAFLTDFGIASVHETMVSLTGSALLGTPAYMSPEQARGDQVTTNSDQYSLGVVLYQMATGRLPFNGETPMAVMYKQIYSPLPAPRLVRTSIPPVIERVILKATAKHPEDRFDSMLEFQQTFRRAIQHIVFPDQVPEPEIVLPRNFETTIAHQDASPEKVSVWRKYPIPSTVAMLFVIGSLITLALLFNSLGGVNSMTRSASTMTSLESVAYEQTISALAARIQQGETPYATDEIQTLVAATMAANSSLSIPQVAEETDSSSTVTVLVADTGSPTQAATLSAATTPPPSQTVAVIIPSATRTRTPTETPTATSTHTPTPTFTSTPTFTITPSPTPDVCSTTSLGSPAIDGNVVRVVVRNNAAATVSITAFSVSWPRENEALIRVELSGRQVWSGSQTSPPLDLALSDAFQLEAGASAQLVFSFSEDARDSGYRFTVRLNAVCTISADQ